MKSDYHLLLCYLQRVVGRVWLVGWRVEADQLGRPSSPDLAAEQPSALQPARRSARPSRPQRSSCLRRASQPLLPLPYHSPTVNPPTPSNVRPLSSVSALSSTKTTPTLRLRPVRRPPAGQKAKKPAARVRPAPASRDAHRHAGTSGGNGGERNVMFNRGRLCPNFGAGGGLWLDGRGVTMLGQAGGREEAGERAVHHTPREEGKC